MPTTKPRLSLTLPPSALAAVRRLAAADGRPVASVLASYVVAAAPTLDRLASALEAVKAHRTAADASLVAGLQAGVDALEPGLRSLLDELDRVAAAGPPPCNHGGQVSTLPPSSLENEARNGRV